MKEPARGCVVVGRHRDHHTAGVVWHRDDREGHEDARGERLVWWFHDGSRWTSWKRITHYALARDLELVSMGPLWIPGDHTDPDGACDPQRCFYEDKR